MDDDDDPLAAGLVEKEVEEEEEVEGGSEGESESDETASEDEEAERDPEKPLRTHEDLAELAEEGASVRPLHVLRGDDRRTPLLLTRMETAQVVALMADFIARNGTALPPNETDRFPLHDFSRLAAIREIQLGLAPMKIRRRLGALPNGEEIWDEMKLSEMAKPHLTF